MSDESRAEHRVPAVALGLVAAVALGYALLSQQWLASRTEDVGFGLRRGFVCDARGACTGIANADAMTPGSESTGTIGGMVEASGNRAQAPWVALGWITSGLIALAIAALLTAAGFAWAHKRIGWPVMPTTIAFLGVALALVTGCLFAALKPGPPGYIGVGPGFAAFGLGVLFGLWSSVMLARLVRPADPDLLEDAMNPEQF